ncbi:hypothetical protein VaNZ11_016117 [Volvox africanus]|uniref:MutL C-terminal dimerisation domain-containing protein n=1 Tax=Volvox africanus TaxID=51714 RepID=A0ABQ5SPF9_9CHLO|nr:hypothetical protein VaNZ11_016117 [Volvox africanus]
MCMRTRLGRYLIATAPLSQRQLRLRVVTFPCMNFFMLSSSNSGCKPHAHNYGCCLRMVSPRACRFLSQVRLREYGSALVEVADNGLGVPPADYQALTLKYHTSKISSFDDLTSVSTYGFRGEALSSLCAVSELSVVTRTAEQATGVRLEYDHEGLLTCQSPAPRAVGTTVAVKNLFATMPVRHKEFMRNVKREFARAISVLQAYALIATHARLIVTNQAGKSGARTTVFTTAAPACTYKTYAATTATALATVGPSAAGGTLPGCLGVVLSSAAAAAADPQVRGELAALRDNLVAVFGGRVAESLEPLVLPEDPETGVRVVGWVSRAGCGLRGDASRQFFFLNGRPVDLPKASRILNDAFKSLSSPAHAAACRPMAVLAVKLAAEEVDVNVTPDKRRVFMAAEDRLSALLQQALLALWEPSRCTFAVNQPLSVGPAVATGSTGCSALVAVVAGPEVGIQRGATRQQRQLQLKLRGESGAAAPAGGGKASSCNRALLQQSDECPSPDADSIDGTMDGIAAGDGKAEVNEKEVSEPRKGRAAKRARLTLSEDAYGVAAAGQSSSPRAVLNVCQPDNAVEPSPGPGVAAAAAAMEAAKRQQRSPNGQIRCSMAAPPPFRHPFLSMFSSFADVASKGKGPQAGVEQAEQENAVQNIDVVTSQREVAVAHPQLMDRVDTGLALTVEEAVDVEMREAQEEKPVDQGHRPSQQNDPWVSAARMQATASMETDEVRLELDTFAVKARANIAGMDVGTSGGKGMASIPNPIGSDEEEPRDQLRLGRGERTTAAGVEQHSRQPAAAVAVAATTPAAVLRLEPGQLAETTAARVRHLQAQQQSWLRRQEEATAEGGGHGTTATSADAVSVADTATPAVGRRFISASLQEDATVSSGIVSEEGNGGGGGTRAKREAAAERELERIFRKSQFREMQVLGQFNLGFILARHGSDVFIIDQHAAAEKTTFERLQRTVVLTRQPLLVPMTLPKGLLLPVDHLLIRDHVDLFRRNGFDFMERRPDGVLVPLKGCGAAPRCTGTTGPGQEQQQRTTQAQTKTQVQTRVQQEKQEEQHALMQPLAPQQQLEVRVEVKYEQDEVSGGLGPMDTDVLEPIRGALQGEGWADADACSDWHDTSGGDAGNAGESWLMQQEQESYDDTGNGELVLSSVPVSRVTGQLGMEDVVELVGMLRAGEGPAAMPTTTGSGNAVFASRQRAWEEEMRPSRVRTMLASRACRSSIMVGKPLSRPEMRRLLDGLADLRQPWNCPHGRPTMRHVCVLPDQPGLPPA